MGPGASERDASVRTAAEERAAEELEAFAASALEWPLVRAVLEPFAPGPLGKRALRERGPRSDPDARQALVRAAEVLANPERLALSAST